MLTFTTTLLSVLGLALAIASVNGAPDESPMTCSVTGTGHLPSALPSFEADFETCTDIALFAGHDYTLFVAHFGTQFGVEASSANECSLDYGDPFFGDYSNQGTAMVVDVGTLAYFQPVGGIVFYTGFFHGQDQIGFFSSSLTTTCAETLTGVWIVYDMGTGPSTDSYRIFASESDCQGNTNVMFFGDVLGSPSNTYDVNSYLFEYGSVSVDCCVECGGGDIMGDPHFFVGSSLYDWKQVGVYNHLVFDDHAVTLEVKDFSGCDGQVEGEFILGVAINTAHAWTAACDGIYETSTGKLAAATGLRVSTPCTSFDMVLTNGYLNLYNITTSCAVKGGVHKALNDHAAANVDGWWEWTETSGFELKDLTVPKVVPLEKKPRVITIDL